MLRATCVHWLIALLPANKTRSSNFARLIEPTCEQEWRLLVACEIEANRTPGRCVTSGGLGSLLVEPNPCQAEFEAYSSCSSGKRGTFMEVTGSRGTCHYFDQSGYGQCVVGYSVGKNTFSSVCESLPALRSNVTVV